MYAAKKAIFDKFPPSSGPTPSINSRQKRITESQLVLHKDVWESENGYFVDCTSQEAIPHIVCTPITLPTSFRWPDLEGKDSFFMFRHCDLLALFFTLLNILWLFWKLILLSANRFSHKIRVMVPERSY